SASTNAMRDASGDHAGSVAAASSRVSCRSVLLRTSWIQMFIEPLRSDEYASDAPSGDHAAAASRAGSEVSRLGVPPIGLSHRSPSAANATRLPAGDSA